VAAQSKAYVCGHSFAGIASSNPSDGMDVSLLWLLSVVQVQASARGLSPVEKSHTDCGMSLCVIYKPNDEESMVHTGHKENIN
jgi:hypothetical protein